jgi:hypothetical protein
MRNASGKVRGVLHDLVVLKDNFDTFDLPTSVAPAAGRLVPPMTLVVKKLWTRDDQDRQGESS